MHQHSQRGIFYGTTTLGEKGQIVIPSEARTAMKLKKGEKLLVFAMGDGMVALAKLAHLAHFEKHLTQKLQSIRKAVRSVK